MSDIYNFVFPSLDAGDDGTKARDPVAFVADVIKEATAGLPNDADELVVKAADVARKPRSIKVVANMLFMLVEKIILLKGL
mmetsp:Transcript_5640/g.7879  ORF Transcript_5640/g.7879 Transcript_5640/m.7879 type:complete len:81 (+) Transcript_5640:460-702(+)